MQIKADNPEDYISKLPVDRRRAFSNLRNAILENLPDGFEEKITYGMIGYVVPHSIYPKGYHADPKQPLPFINLASQKNYIAIYHMGLYGDKKLLKWFTDEYSKQSKAKLDMGKGCIRFKKTDQIPYQLIAELATRITVKDWINTYENNRKR